MRRLATILSGCGIVCASVLVTLTPGVASASPPGHLAISAITVAPGGSEVVSGGGCRSDAAVTIRLVPRHTLQNRGVRSRVIGTTTAKSTGNFRTGVTIPISADQGAYYLQSTCIAHSHSTLTLEAAITVQKPRSYPPNTGTLTVSSSTVTAGGTETVSGGGCGANRMVSIALVPGRLLGTTPADASGDFTKTVRIPPSTGRGSYQLQSTCLNPTGGTETLSAAITVRRASSASLTAAQTTLPVAGGNVILPVGIVILLLTIGSVGVVYARRRPRLAAKD